MVLDTKVHGFTAWVNLRLAPEGFVLHNVLTDLLKGRHIKALLESLTGKPSRKVDSFDGLSMAQKQTRVDWMLDELRRMELVKGFSTFDSRLFAMRSADSVFDLLWCLVCHDIWFIWERSKFLQQNDEQLLISCPFSWTPPSPPVKQPANKPEISLMSGFGASSIILKEVATEDMTEKWTSRKALVDRDIEMIEPLKPNSDGLYPCPEVCIMHLINVHLKLTKEGQKLVRGVLTLADVSDSRVLCALVNSFIPGTFTSEVLLNDRPANSDRLGNNLMFADFPFTNGPSRWTVNLILTSISEMFRCLNPFAAEDLVQNDTLAVCAYLTFFFMSGYKYRQAKAVIHRKETLLSEKFCAKEELSDLMKNETEWTRASMSRKMHLEEQISRYNLELEFIDSHYDCEDFLVWMKKVTSVQGKIRTIVAQKIKEQYEIVVLPSTMTINELVSTMMINLNITSGIGFYEAKAKETLTSDRRIVARNIETGELFDDSARDAKSHGSARAVLGIPRVEVVEVMPSQYPMYELFFDSPSRNKLLKAGSRFMYKVFPGNNAACQKMLLKAAAVGDLDVVKKLVNFFEKDKAFVNCREKGSKNTALHLASRHGHYDIVQFLLERRADVNMENILGLTPLFLSVDAVDRDVSMLLVEWDANLYHRNRHGRTVLELTKHTEMRDALVDKFDSMKKIGKSILGADFSILREEILRHHAGEKRFTSLKSRSINGSTVLHTASYFGDHEIMKILLAQGMDVNLRDYVGATPIHRAKDVTAMEILLEAGADVNAVDQDDNNVLHLNCYGESGATADTSLLMKLIEKRVSLAARNKRGLMPIHCGAMQGSIDVIEFLLKQDDAGEIRESLMKEAAMPPSLPHLAVANDHIIYARWLLNHDFGFKTGEGNLLLEKVLLEQVPCENYCMTVSFLIEAGASASTLYPGGNTALHLVASQSHMTEVIDLLVDCGADVNALNSNRCTPLFFATKSDNIFGASSLIRLGADLKIRNYQGQTAFDLITDIDGWIESGCFSEESIVRLKAYNLKEARTLIRAITRRVRGLTVIPLTRQTRATSGPHQRSRSVPAFLPPIFER